MKHENKHSAVTTSDIVPFSNFPIFNLSFPYLCPMKLLRALLFTVLLFFAGPASTFAQGCPMCKTSLTKARDGGETQVGNTINEGILYMLAFPYLIAGAFGYIYYRNYKQKKALQQQGE
jgi:hypothetical protein